MAPSKRPGADRDPGTRNDQPAREPANPTRDVRPWVYAGVDVVFAALYLALAFWILPVEGASFRGVSIAVGAAALVAGVGTAARRPWGWWAGILGSAVVLVMGAGIVILLVLAAAYMKGIYGAVGRGAALGSVVAAALTVEVYCLWPCFQLGYLLSRAGRRGARRARGEARP